MYDMNKKTLVGEDMGYLLRSIHKGYDYVESSWSYRNYTGFMCDSKTSQTEIFKERYFTCVCMI